MVGHRPAGRKRPCGLLGPDPPPPPTAEPRLLRPGLCRQAHLESEQWQEWARQLRQPAGVMNRKTWEFCYIAQALSERGLLKAGMRGLGFGVGQEPLAAFFAGRGCEIVATDLHDDLVHDDWKAFGRSEEHTSELQSQSNLVCRLLLEKK